MGWGRLDDDYATHPKIVAVGPLAMALDVAAICYSNRHLTDGFVPAGVVPMLINVSGLLNDADPLTGGRRNRIGITVEVRDLVDRLTSEGVWEHADGGYLIHDFLEFNKARKDVLAERESNAQRQALFKARKQKGNGVNNSVTGAALTAEKQAGNKHPVPDPDPNRREVVCPAREDDKPLTKREATFVAFWDIHPERRGRLVGKSDAGRAFEQYVAPGEEDAFLEAARHYAASEEATKEQGKYAKTPANWIPDWTEWVDDVSESESPVAAPQGWPDHQRPEHLTELRPTESATPAELEDKRQQLIALGRPRLAEVWYPPSDAPAAIARYAARSAEDTTEEVSKKGQEVFA